MTSPQIKWIAIVWLTLSTPVVIGLWLAVSDKMAMWAVGVCALPVVLAVAFWGIRYEMKVIERLFARIVTAWRLALGLPEKW